MNNFKKGRIDYTTFHLSILKLWEHNIWIRFDRIMKKKYDIDNAIRFDI